MGHPGSSPLRGHPQARLGEIPERACEGGVLLLGSAGPALADRLLPRRVVDGLGQTVHERLFAVQLNGPDSVSAVDPGVLGNLIPGRLPDAFPEIAAHPEPSGWLHQNVLWPFLEEVKAERLQEIDRISASIELSLTELLQRADEEIGRAAADVEQGQQGAERSSGDGRSAPTPSCCTGATGAAPGARPTEGRCPSRRLNGLPA